MPIKKLRLNALEDMLGLLVRRSEWPPLQLCERGRLLPPTRLGAVARKASYTFAPHGFAERYETLTFKGLRPRSGSAGS